MAESFFSPQVKIFLVVTAAAALVAVLIAIFAALAMNRSAAEAPAMPMPEVENSTQGLSIEDFYVPQPEQTVPSLDYFPAREASSQWTEEQARSRLVPVEEIIEDTLLNRTEAYLDELFDEIP
jgi:hypothetical protein